MEDGHSIKRNLQIQYKTQPNYNKIFHRLRRDSPRIHIAKQNLRFLKKSWTITIKQNKQKNTTEGLTISYFKLYCRDIIRKPTCYWHKTDKRMNEIELKI